MTAKNSLIMREFIKQFKCLGADCVDTCCQGWNMQLSDETYAQYKAEAPELLDAVTGVPGEYIMRRDPKTSYCVKFSNGWCGIQQEYGEDFLGEACYSYPRATRALGETITMTATLSCPEIARLSLFDDAALTQAMGSASRLPTSTKDVLPDSLSSEQALAIHQLFIDLALDKNAAPERSVMRVFAVAESLERISVGSWPDAVPFYMQHADAGLPPPENMPTDQIYLLQALCGLLVAAKKVNNPRLMQTVSDMEKALHVTIRMDNLAIVPLPDSDNAVRTLPEVWRERYEEIYAPVLRRYLAMQLSLALFPFYGFGGSLTERVAIIGIRFATVKLGLMSACSVAGKSLEESEVIRVVQSISRFLDHLAGTDFSLKIYQETGWLKKARLRALLGDEE